MAYAISTKPNQHHQLYHRWTPLVSLSPNLGLLILAKFLLLCGSRLYRERVRFYKEVATVMIIPDNNQLGSRRDGADVRVAHGKRFGEYRLFGSGYSQPPRFP
ncbi:MAG: hypothetical protein KatS3mg021_1281 [Fimbriimonadales bacterium]|nr:MAG: hypothetical protein KatS3mg021_1281 [Fimbriimonadales bacterium]